MSTAAGQPLDGRAVATRFDAVLGPFRHVVLAVSGGVDSVAMMHLAAAWRAARLASVPARDAPVLSVVTVDHGLRPESAAEAKAVEHAAGQLGLVHATLVWTGAKPATGIQAAARAARYRLIEAHQEALGADAVATAHTSDDQAETLLMRLARGSGVDGLAGIQERTILGAAALLRPMLSFSKQDLIATLEAKGVTWMEDPSNDRADFERVRLRQLRDKFEAAGLSNRALALSARRLGRARQALDEVTTYFATQPGNHLHIDALGYADVSWCWLTTLPDEIRLRLLTRLVGAIGGSEEPVSMSGLEAMTEGEDWKSPAGHSLAGAVFSAGKDERILIVREYGRKNQPLPELELDAGQSRLWDRRFTVVNGTVPARRLRVCALGAEGLAAVKAALKKRGSSPPAHPLAALYTIPSFWEGGQLAAVPLLNYFVTGSGPNMIQSSFAGLEVIKGSLNKELGTQPLPDL